MVSKKPLKSELEALINAIKTELDRILVQSDEIITLLEEDKKLYYWGRISTALDIKKYISDLEQR